MDPIDAKRLDKLEETVKENNKLLHKLHRAMITRRVMRVLYWVILIGVALGAFYFLQPYIEIAQDTFDQASGVLDIFQGDDADEDATTVEEQS